MNPVLVLKQTTKLITLPSTIGATAVGVTMTNPLSVAAQAVG